MLVPVVPTEFDHAHCHCLFVLRAPPVLDNIHPSTRRFVRCPERENCSVMSTACRLVTHSEN